MNLPNFADLFRKVFSITQKQAPTTFGMFRSQDLMQGYFTPAQYEKMAVQGYGKCSAAYSCINLIVKNFAEIEWQVYDYSKGEDKKELVTDWENKHFIEKPNPISSEYSFKEAIAGYYMIAGDSYILAVTNASGRKPVWFYPIRPSMVEPIKGKDGITIEYYWIGDGVERVKVPAYLMYHQKSFNPLSYTNGVSPMQAILQDIDLINSGKCWNTSLQQNMGKPSGIVSAKPILTDNGYKRLADQVRGKFQGSKNVGNVWIGDGDLSWSQTSINPTDVDWLEGLKFSKGEIAVNFGVPPELIGIAEQKTYANVKEARQSFYKETIIPFAKLSISEANRWLKLNGWLPENYYIEIDYKSISGLEEDENDLFVRLDKASWLTDNEKRIKSGYEPDEKRESWNLTKFEKEIILAYIKKGIVNEETEKLKSITLSNKKLLSFKSSIYRSNHPSVVNCFSEKEKKEVSLKIEDDREKIEEKYTLIIIEMLKNEYRKVMKMISDASASYSISALASKAIDSTFRDWMLVLGNGNKSIANEFAVETIRDISGSLSNVDEEMFDLKKIEKQIKDLINESIEETVRDINATSKDKIARIIAKGIEEGKTTNEIIKLIDELYLVSMIPNRSKMIAKTETVKSSNAGSYLAALNSPVQLDKVWISIIDSRTRVGEFNHVHPDGQKVGINEFFTVSGEKMRYPADSSLGASAGNVINCRCSQVYMPKEK